MAGALQELVDGVFAWVHDATDRFTCNIGVIVSDDSLTLVDSSGVPSSYLALARALERFRKPVTRLVLTHAHGDHVAGATLFPEAEVICSAACAQSLASPPVIAAYQKLHPSVAEELVGLRHPIPTRVLDTSARLDQRLGVDILSGHTHGDLVLRIDDAGIVFAGDLCFFGYVPLGIGADFAAWRSSLERLSALRPQRIVPGHGFIGTQVELDLVASYLEAVLDAAAHATRVPKGPWSAWHDPWDERVPNAIDRINVEQARSPHGFPATLRTLLVG